MTHHDFTAHNDLLATVAAQRARREADAVAREASLRARKALDTMRRGERRRLWTLAVVVAVVAAGIVASAL